MKALAKGLLMSKLLVIELRLKPGRISAKARFNRFFPVSVFENQLLNL